MTIVGIHQPQYLPWLGLIERVSRCDIFVVLDTVQYSKNYFYNRNRIKTPDGFVWLTVPVLTKGLSGQTFLDVRIDNSKRWPQKQWKSMQQFYSGSPYFNHYYSFFKNILEKEWTLLHDLCFVTFQYLLDVYNISTKIVRASEIGAIGSKESLILDICKKMGATKYLSGPDGKNYLDLSVWAKNMIKVDFQRYNHPLYGQMFNKFIPNLSVIDLLFNCGPAGIKILKDEQPDYFD